MPGRHDAGSLRICLSMQHARPTLRCPGRRVPAHNGEDSPATQQPSKRSPPVKTILTEVFGTALLLVMGGVSSAQAQLAYGNTVLNGCYGYLATSSDTESPPQNRSVVGTLCFDGAGNIVGVTGSPGLTGNTANTNGTVASASALTGTYKVTNSPGDGMGTWVLDRCTTEAFTINTLD